MDGIHIFYPTFSSGQSVAPFKTLEDYENNLKRHREVPAEIDCSIARFREGLKSGVVDTKITIQNVIDQLNLQLAQKPEESPYYGPVQKFPAVIGEDDQRRLRQVYGQIISSDLFTAYRRLRDFLRDEYLPRAREGVGLVHMKDGRRLYDFLIENSTTTKVTADEVHDLGLSEVARIRGAMVAISKEVGFSGSLGEFFQHIRTDQGFQPTSAEWLRNRYYEIAKQVDNGIRSQFSSIPKAKLDIRPVEPFREKTEPGGSYIVGSRPSDEVDFVHRTSPSIQ